MEGEVSPFLGVGMRPRVGQQQVVGVRRVAQQIVLRVGLARFDIGGLLANLDQGVAEPVEFTIWHPAETTDRMTPFVRDMHERSGLLRQIQTSKTSLEEAEQEVLTLVSMHCEYGTARLCGNSIWQDRRFLERYMPALVNYLHYRMIDVSSIKELAGWWYGIQHRKPKGAQHTALWDTRQSIAELKYYREQLVNPEVESAE